MIILCNPSIAHIVNLITYVIVTISRHNQDQELHKVQGLCILVFCFQDSSFEMVIDELRPKYSA